MEQTIQLGGAASVFQEDWFEQVEGGGVRGRDLRPGLRIQKDEGRSGSLEEVIFADGPVFPGVRAFLDRPAAGRDIPIARLDLDSVDEELADQWSGALLQ